MNLNTDKTKYYEVSNMVYDLLVTVGSAAIGGISWGVLGYLRNRTKHADQLDVNRLIKPALIGAALGIVSMYQGTGIDAVATATNVAILTPIVEKVINLGWELNLRYFPKLK